MAKPQLKPKGSRTIEDYLKSKELAWSDSTMKSEASRLGRYGKWLYKDPEACFKSLKSKLAPYTLQTLFVRLSEAERFLSGTDRFAQFRASHARLFKHSYRPKRIELSYSEAMDKIKTIKEPYRTKALQLLTSGMRYTESLTLNDGLIIGKGGKRRDVAAISILREVSHTALSRALKSIGLTPHTLRKLFATRLVEQGIELHDLKEVMGWSSIETAASYLQPKKREVLNKFIASAIAE